MIHYSIKPLKAVQQYIPITITVPVENNSELTFSLPFWRPGRYEVGNFAKLIRGVQAKGLNGQELSITRVDLHTWKVETAGLDSITLNYQFHANQFDSGNSYLAEDLFYMNPINALMYVHNKMEVPHVIELALPNDYEIATSLQRNDHGVWLAADYHELADSPVMASNNLQLHKFEQDGLVVKLALYGPAKPDWDKIEQDFRPFIREQRAQFSDIPVSEYWFLILTANFRKYHGVEHLKSTVLTLGPGYLLMDKRYDDLIELASHEFYHLWNIKSIRPAELMPYNYNEITPFTTGFVAEGVTVYYGDITLARSGAYDWNKYYKILEQSFQRHGDNNAKEYNSLANSSLELWLDGYSREVPDRKLSIYTDGCLLALLADLHTLKHTDGDFGLHDVMNVLYMEYAKKGIGYTEQEYFDTITKVSGKDASYIQGLLHSAVDYLPQIEALMLEFGLAVKSVPSETIHESRWGVKLNPGENVVVGVYLGSIAEKAGIRVGDHIMTINGFEYKQNLEDWSNFFDADAVTLRVERLGQIIPVELQAGDEAYYHSYRIKEISNPSMSQIARLNYWKKSANE